MDLDKIIHGIALGAQQEFARQKAVLSFQAYANLLARSPARLTRTVARYVVDAFAAAGSHEIDGSGGRVRRWHLFDDAGSGGETGSEVFGHEAAQNRICDILSEFARRGRNDRFILLHGPNGSAKSSLVDAIVRGLERYSQTAEGALYRFSWIFCEGGERDRLGFQPGKVIEGLDSLADVDERMISSRVPCEMKDPPYLLIPRAHRRAFFEAALQDCDAGERAGFAWNEAVVDGDLSPKSRVIYDSLLKAYAGDWQRVVRHIRVERWYVSRRYRSAAVTIEPQGTIDASSRMLSHGSSAGLPPVLLHESLVEAVGDLVDANRGIVEFSDFFKRPVEASKYLLTTIERGVLNLPGLTAHLDAVMFGTTNEKYLAAFKRDAAFPSFKGRFELVRVPYLVEYKKEAQIYARHLGHVRGARHVAPHTATAIALWAVLTRLRRPQPSRYPQGVQTAIRKLTPLRKARLYDRGEMPPDLGDEEEKLLRAEINNLRREYDGVEEEIEGYVDAAYEGRDGASPREIMAMLSDIAVATTGPCISPVEIFESLPRLIGDKTLYRFLRLEKDGAYHDPAGFIEDVRREYIRHVAREIHQASDLVSETEYARLFAEYFRHVRAFDTHDKVANVQTGKPENPDEKLMSSVEVLLDLHEPAERFRRDLMTKIAAFRIDNPTQPLVYETLFSSIFTALKKKVYADQLVKLTRMVEDALESRGGGAAALSQERRAASDHLQERLVGSFGYCDTCVTEVLAYFLRHRGDVSDG